MDDHPLRCPVPDSPNLVTDATEEEAAMDPGVDIEIYAADRAVFDELRGDLGARIGRRVSDDEAMDLLCKFVDRHLFDLPASVIALLGAGGPKDANFFRLMVRGARARMADLVTLANGTPEADRQRR